nr:hypothetical protein [Allomuricauda sp.]
MKYLYFLIAVHFVSSNLSAQVQYGLKAPNANEKQQFCNRLEQIFYAQPKEITFGVNEDHQNNLYFQFNDKAWFESLFVDTLDGMAIDVVTKDAYDCNSDGASTAGGEILKPVYANNLKNKIEELGSGSYRIWVGKLPNKYFHKQIEFNIIFLSKKYICRYQTTYNLQSYNYQLLDMGLYMDSITYADDYLGLDVDGFDIKYKTLDFQIPFEKNKVTFSPTDIKPLYDSLRLTDFSIKQIDIQAYSSIEGSEEINKRLQEKRSQSIANALQSFQKPDIQTTVTTSENWVEFLNDIQGTKFEGYKNLSKKKIKEKVTGTVAEELEPYLKRHRKALITLYLERIDQYKTLAGEELVGQFNEAIANDQLSEAQQLQNSLFERIKLREVNPDVLDKLSIPKQKKFVDFFNSNSAFRHRMNTNSLMEAYYEFQELNKLDPDNKKVAYNMLALKLRMNHVFNSITDGETLLEKIRALEGMGIQRSLVQRMLVNYHITNSELLMQERKYYEKDASVRFILETYSEIPLGDMDYLSLAQYLSHYFNTTAAIVLLKDKVKQINVNRALLFYYLNLTLVHDNITQKPEYRTIMLNAINLDRARFCRLFDSAEIGGVTFQLLNNEYLKATYCENCESGL